jgi:hypothetical protein
MNNRIEKQPEQFNHFTREIYEYLEVNKIPFENHLVKNFIENAQFIIGSHCNPIQTARRFMEMFKADDIGEQIPAGTRMEQNDEGVVRRLISTEDSITLTKERRAGGGLSTLFNWSHPIENSRVFSRFEARADYLVPFDKNRAVSGSMNLFFDIPDYGTPRFQLLVTYDGLLPQLQKEPFDCYTVGGTYSPDGKRLVPGEYDL